jgi:hypothetical protein
LFGLAADLESVPVWKVATRSSLDLFLKSEASIPLEARPIFENYAESLGAPRRSQHWRELYERLFVPATLFGQQRWKQARRMGRSAARHPDS